MFTTMGPVFAGSGVNVSPIANVDYSESGYLFGINQEISGHCPLSIAGEMFSEKVRLT